MAVVRLRCPHHVISEYEFDARCAHPRGTVRRYDVHVEFVVTQWGLDTLFNPAKRHMDEEKRRLQSTREEIGDSSGGDRIDFDSGKVVIRRKRPVKAEAETVDMSADEAAGAHAESDTESAEDVDDPEDAEAR